MSLRLEFNFLFLLAKVVHARNFQDPTFAQPNNYKSLLGFLPQPNLQNAKDIIMSLRLEFNFLCLVAKVIHGGNSQDPTFGQPNNYKSLLGFVPQPNLQNLCKSLLGFLCLVAKVVHGRNSQDPTFAQPNNYTSLLDFDTSTQPKKC